MPRLLFFIWYTESYLPSTQKYLLSLPSCTKSHTVPVLLNYFPCNLSWIPGLAWNFHGFSPTLFRCKHITSLLQVWYKWILLPSKLAIVLFISVYLEFSIPLHHRGNLWFFLNYWWNPSPSSKVPIFTKYIAAMAHTLRGVWRVGMVGYLGMWTPAPKVS